MYLKKIQLTILNLCGLFLALQASAFEVENIHCLRQERLNSEIYLSEIHFTKTSVSTVFAGEVVSYSLHGTVKNYVSGYNLFSVSYHKDVISGLTGDEITGADGSFNLTRVNQKNNGVWTFSYCNKDGSKINADFKCIYSGTDPFGN